MRQISEEEEQARGESTGLGNIRHMARQSALLLSSTPLSYLGALILNLVLARTLGAASFGAWAVAVSVASGLARLGLVGADWIVIRHGSYFQSSGDEARLRRTLHFALLLSGTSLVLVGGCLLALAPILAEQVFHTSRLTPLLRFAAVLVPVSGVGFIMLYGTKAFQSLREEAVVANVIRPAARILFVGMALLVVSSELSAFLGLIVAEFVITSAATVALRRRMRIIGPTEAIDHRAMMRFALPAWGTRIAENVRKQSFPIMLGALVSLSATGVFVVSQRIALALGAIIGTIEQIYSPMAASLHLGNRPEELGTLFRSMAKVSFVLAFPLFCLQVTFPQEIMALFGGAFRHASAALILLAVGMLFSFGTGPVTPTLIVSGRSRTALLNYLIVVATEVALGFWLIPRLGVLGAAAARMVGIATLNCSQLFVVWRKLGLQPYRRDFWKPTVAGVLAAILARLAVTASGLAPGLAMVLLGALVLLATYVALLLAFRLSEEDRAVVGAAVGVLLRHVGQVRPMSQGP